MAYAYNSTQEAEAGDWQYKVNQASTKAYQGRKEWGGVGDKMWNKLALSFSKISVFLSLAAVPCPATTEAITQTELSGNACFMQVQGSVLCVLRPCLFKVMYVT